MRGFSSLRNCLLGLTSLAVVVVGCSPERLQVEADTPAEGPTLPTLPPAAQRHPELYDDDGCLGGAAAGECLTSSVDVDEAAAQPDAGSEVERQLLGFSGPGYLPDPGPGGLVVLTDTVAVGRSSRWSASGLVRDESTSTLESVEVRADLVAFDGRPLGAATADVLVAPLRPGEPAPFRIEAAVPAGEVGEVRWTALPGPAVAGEADQRSLGVTNYWTRPYGDPAPVDNYLHRDDPGVEHPYVMFGAVTNYGQRASGAVVVAAWKAADGTLLHAAQVEAACITGDLPEGQSCDFMFSVSDPVAGPRLTDSTLVVWAIAR